MRILGLFAVLALAACSSSSDPAYITGFDVTSVGITICRTTVTQTQKPFDCCSSTWEEHTRYVAFAAGDGHVLGRGDTDACGRHTVPPAVPVVFADGTRVVSEPDAATGGLDAVATDSSGTELWRTPLPIADITRSVHDASSLYFSDGHDVVALDVAGGILRWDQTL